jgi:hypothetical protein
LPFGSKFQYNIAGSYLFISVVQAKTVAVTDKLWGIVVNHGNLINLCLLNTDNFLSAPKRSVLFSGDGYRRLWGSVMNKIQNTGNKEK